ncbi:hypothetical protein HY971_05205 [Candidatus Kaiserbacteria bacterium]|nr:hypothetical protein [Candidatus Kaiserbacteria bacterium]
MIFTKKNADGSVDFVSSVWNYSEWSGAEWGYMGVGTDPFSGSTFTSLGTSYEPLLQTVFKVGVYSPSLIKPVAVSASVNQQYQQFAFSPSGKGFYAVNESLYPAPNNTTFGYTNAVLYRFSQGLLTKVFSDHVDAPTDINKAVLGSDMAYTPDGRLYYMYYKAPAVNGNCNYLVKENADGSFSSPVGVGCFNQPVFNQGPYPQLQIDSKGNVYILSFDHTNLVLAKSTDDGTTWTRYTVPVNYVPSDTVALTGPTILKPWTSPRGYNPDQLYGIMGGEDTNRNAWYLATFCINLADMSVTCAGTTPTPPPITPSVSIDKTTYVSGDTVTITATNPTPTAKDWFAIVTAGTKLTGCCAGIPWTYADNAQTSTKTLKANVPAGTYEVVYFANNSFTEITRSSSFAITPVVQSNSDALTPSSFTVPAGGTLSVSWTKATSSVKDWIAFAPTGQAWSAGNPWVYTGGASQGSKNILAPAFPSIYDLVYYINDTMTEALRKSGIQVTPPSGAAALVPGTQTPKVGAQLAVSWYVPGQTNVKDWVALVPQGQQWAASYPWFYTDAAKSGTKTIVVPNTSGIYDIVYFANDNPSVEIYRASGIVTVQN